LYGAVEELGLFLVDGVDLAFGEDGVVACVERDRIFGAPRRGRLGVVCFLEVGHGCWRMTGKFQQKLMVQRWKDLGGSDLY